MRVGRRTKIITEYRQTGEDADRDGDDLVGIVGNGDNIGGGGMPGTSTKYFTVPSSNAHSKTCSACVTSALAAEPARFKSTCLVTFLKLKAIDVINFRMKMLRKNDKNVKTWKIKKNVCRRLIKNVAINSTSRTESCSFSNCNTCMDK